MPKESRKLNIFTLKDVVFNLGVLLQNREEHRNVRACPVPGKSLHHPYRACAKAVHGPLYVPSLASNTTR